MIIYVHYVNDKYIFEELDHFPPWTISLFLHSSQYHKAFFSSLWSLLGLPINVAALCYITYFVF